MPSSPAMHINTSVPSFNTSHHDVSPMASPTLSRVNTRLSAVSSMDESIAPSTVFSPTYGHDNTTGSFIESTTTQSIEHSCNFDTDDWFGQFRDDLDVSDDCPDRGTLAAAGEVPLYDAYGNTRPFKTFFQGLDAVGERQLVIFIRHFYCGACQAYLTRLANEITMQAYYTMPVPTSIMVVGCGSHKLIAHYKRQSGCPFPIFADPTRKLFRILGMSMTLNFGIKAPEYHKGPSVPMWVIDQLRQMAQTKGGKKFKGGNWMQIGGEFLFQDAQVVWCHRMRNYRDHAEVPVIKRVLEIEE